jgi:phosphate transport system substrate-binding protein
MKKLILGIAMLATVAANAQIKVKGSDTVLPLGQKEAEGYMKANSSKSVSVTGGGSGVGIAALIDNTTDIAASSRSMKMDEKLKISEAGKSLKETVIAYDALSIIVNPSNPVSQLTREQLEGIFTGKITNWKQVGGNDLKIIAYTRESSSGTFEFIKDHVLKGKNFASSALSMPATGAIVQAVSQTKGAIGYVGVAYSNATVKDLKVSFDKGKTFIAPSIATAKNKTYPITRPLYFYYTSGVEAKVKPFISYILSAQGQANVLKVGYVPLN